MKQQLKKSLSNPMSNPRSSKRIDSCIRRLMLIGIPLTIIIYFFIFSSFVQQITTSPSESSQKGPSDSVGRLRSNSNIVIGTSTKATTIKTSANQSEEVDDENDIIIIKTKHGDIEIVLRPDLSKESVAYIRKFIETGVCTKCQFYRSEKNLLLQGILRNSDIPTNKVFGPCPDSQPVSETKINCPKHDPNCGCHGPIMTKGMVGWAGGSSGGPDFFINTFHKPVDWWEHQHTVWGEIQDDRSFQILDKIYELPVTKKGMWMLDEKIDFSVAFK